MAPQQTPVTDVEEDDDVMSDPWEDLELSSFSEFAPSTDESKDGSDDEPPLLRGHRRRRQPRRTNAHRQTCPPSQTRALWPTPGDATDAENTAQPQAPEPAIHNHANGRRGGCRCHEVRVIMEKWGNRRWVRDEQREEFEKKIFGKEYPELSELNIPAARCDVIMAAGEARAKMKESLESAKAIRDGSSDTDMDGGQREESAPSLPTTFSLTRLPLEVQYLILKYCLTTEAPLVDFCLGHQFPPSEFATNERPGQNDISLAMLATNRLFRTQGLQILWQHNRFLYTRSDEYTLLNTDLLMNQPQVNLLRHLTIHQDSVWQPHAFYNRVMLDSILFAVSTTEQFPALQTLDLELATTTVRPYCHERGKWLRATLLEAKYFLRDIRGGRSLRRLKRLSVTGVSDDDVGCLAVKLASFLVAPEGRLGVKLADVRSWGDSGWLIVQGDTDTVWMTLEDVNVWVKWQREQHSNQVKLFEWEDFFSV